MRRKCKENLYGLLLGVIALLLLFLLGIMLMGLPFASFAHAETLKGLDILGLAMQDVKMAKSELNHGVPIGVVQGTFGNANPPLEELINTGKVPAFREHLLNGTCWRNHNCESGEPKVTDLKAIQGRAQKVNALAARHPGIKCYVSPVLEHDEKSQTLVNKWFEILKLEAPLCTPVCSAFRGWCPGNVLIEKHGNEARGDIISNDGQSLYDSDTRSYWDGGKVISFGWINRFNLRLTSEKTFTPPSKRKHKATREDMRQTQALMKPVEPKPSKPLFCKTLKEFEKPELLKSNSEDYAQGAARDNKPVIILKRKHSRFEVLSPKGKKIACISYYGTFPGNMHRHYLGTCANKSNTQILKESGSEWVFYKDGNTCYLGNAIRRLGYYRN